MHLRSKQTLEICQKVGSLDEKAEQNHLKRSTLPSLFQKIIVLIEKQKALIDFL